MAELIHYEVIRACASFPNHTGLGWDRWHPKVVLRSPKPLVKLLIDILMEAEKTGVWPRGIGVVLIALLPKGDGDYRPIGLKPTLTRIWMRSRRNVTKAWEANNSRWYCYAGKGMGADVAAWKQAAAAELSMTMAEYTEYGQALLDLVKAFDRVPIWLLIREAVALGYPLELLRLSVAVYRLARGIRIGKAISFLIFARRGITAGSGFATTEMRLVMIRAVDRALRLHPMVVPTLFVDDLAAAICATMKAVEEELGGFIESVAEFITSTDQQLSPTKSVVITSKPELTDKLVSRWAAKGIKLQKKTRVKALGVGLAAGRSRNISVAKIRLHKYRTRLGKFRMLRRSGVSTARLVRTGLKAMTYGTEILGVATGMLRSQRQTVAAVTAPGHGTGGQNLDLALMMADGKANGRADPAYDAHATPIGQWAMAVWESWEYIGNLNRMIDHAKTNLDEAVNKWAVVRGPAATLVQTCARIGWQVVSATKLVTDIGEELALQLDPPIVVMNKCFEAVQR